MLLRSVFVLFSRSSLSVCVDSFLVLLVLVLPRQRSQEIYHWSISHLHLTTWKQKSPSRPHEPMCLVVLCVGGLTSQFFSTAVRTGGEGQQPTIHHHHHNPSSSSDPPSPTRQHHHHTITAITSSHHHRHHHYHAHAPRVDAQPAEPTSSTYHQNSSNNQPLKMYGRPRRRFHDDHREGHAWSGQHPPTTSQPRAKEIQMPLPLPCCCCRPFANWRPRAGGVATPPWSQTMLCLVFGMIVLCVICVDESVIVRVCLSMCVLGCP